MASSASARLSLPQLSPSPISSIMANRPRGEACSAIANRGPGERRKCLVSRTRSGSVPGQNPVTRAGSLGPERNNN
jgi:hypothetical protein